MKNKILAISGGILIALSLTACEYFMPLFGDSSDGGFNPFRPVSSSVEQASIPSEYNNTSYPKGEIVAQKASCTYDDYVQNSVYAISATPSVGNAKILVIPVWFSDSSTFINESSKEKVRADIENVYFGTDASTGWKSVKTYYEQESFGSLNLTGTVSGWYEPGESYKNYGTDNTGAKTPALVEKAAKWFFNNNPSEKRTDYDFDKDGYLDGVMLIYAAPDYVALGRDSYSNLWAYCYWTQNYEAQSVINPAVNAFFWASYDFMYGSNTVSSRTGKLTGYASGDTRYCTIDAHTYIHEMGHMFGLEDYYDYSDNGYSPAGDFSMQDHNVGGHDPFSSFALGWGKAYIPQESMTINLKPFASSGEMIILTPSWNTYNSPFDEYLILEYYTPTELNAFDTGHKYLSRYPTGTTSSGIRLWHVDARLLYITLLDQEFTADKATTNPRLGDNYGVATMMSNTYDDGSSETRDYESLLGPSYANYNILQLIRNNKNATYKPSDSFGESSLFMKGSYFDMSDYSRQFVNAGKLNSKKDLGYSFIIESVSSEEAVVSIIKK